MDNNSSVPDPFNGPAYQLLSKVSSHPLAQVINVNLQTSFKTFLSPLTQLSLIAWFFLYFTIFSKIFT